MNRSEKRFYAPENWNIHWTTQAPFADLTALFPDLPDQLFPDVTFLNEIAKHRDLTDYEFVANQDLETLSGRFSAAAGLYYEEIIHRFNWIPTREKNWHDWFNALIWLSFPKTKQRLNQLHMQDIQAFGLHPRTTRRNRITLLDECGGVLVYEDEAHLTALQNHDWQGAFLAMREHWGQTTKYFVFGHANYEMLLQPHIGLTGKYIALKAKPEFWQADLAEQYDSIDSWLCAACAEGTLFEDRSSLKPLPLLGIPGWWSENESPQFYANQDYFRPKRSKLAT